MENVSPYIFICSNLRTLFHYLCFGRENNGKCNIISVHHHLKDKKYFPIFLNFIIKPNLQIHYKNHNMPILLVKDKQ
jgi:hypothetical protein